MKRGICTLCLIYRIIPLNERRSYMKAVVSVLGKDNVPESRLIELT